MGSSHARSSTLSQDFTHSKKLIVCCDGTWQNSDSGWVGGTWGKSGHMQNPTNVTRIARAISSEDRAHHPQIVYYQAGIGTSMGLYSHVIGGGTGAGLSENIREAYAFLVNNYHSNNHESTNSQADSIFLIGFSRGAFTARSIGGFIGAIGILKKTTMSHFYQVFSDWENAGNKSYKPKFFESWFELHPDQDKVPRNLQDLAGDNKKIDEYMKAYYAKLLANGLTQEANVQAIGVWDTVGSLGIPINPLLQRVFPFLPSFVREYSWFDTGVDKSILNAFQALGLDEHRFPFSPTLWEKRANASTNIKQTWFPGAHSNIGGSYDDSGIADITLAWMMDHLSGNTMDNPADFKPHDWIQFDEDYIADWQSTDLVQAESKKEPAYKGWAKGYVYESCYFPMSVLGSAVRTPARYHRTVYETGKPDRNNMLENTNEHIHSCVRGRIDLGGKPVEDDWSQVSPHSVDFGPWIYYFFRWLFGRTKRVYDPQRRGGPLQGWRLESGLAGKHKEVCWIYEGEGKCSKKILPEDKLGPFEKKLLERDQNFAKQVTVSNDSWHWVDRDT